MAKGRDAGELDAAILAAHDDGDGALLADLYGEAADLKSASGDDDAAAFLLVQAYVFALESGAPAAAALHQRLVALGREA